MNTYEKLISTIKEFMEAEGNKRNDNYTKIPFYLCTHAKNQRKTKLVCWKYWQDLERKEAKGWDSPQAIYAVVLECIDFLLPFIPEGNIHKILAFKDKLQIVFHAEMSEN